MASTPAPSSSSKDEVSGDVCVSNSEEAVAVSCSSDEVARNEKKKINNIPCLPNEIIYHILLFLPVDVLYYVMRLVCRSWLDMITSPDFIFMHLNRSTPCLLVQNSDRIGPFFTRSSSNYDVYNEKCRRGYFVEIKEDKMNNDNRVLCPEISNPGDEMLHSCDGLVLIKDLKNVLHVKNPATKQRLALTPAPRPLKRRINSKTNLAALCSIGSVSNRREYKVVYSSCLQIENHYMFILTVGVDHSWRIINTDQISDGNILSGSIISVPGFVYWHSDKSRHTVLALDVEAETLHQVNTPKINELQMSSEPDIHYMSSESFLILAVKFVFGKWDLWFLLDTKNGRWEKSYQLDMSDENPTMSLHSGIRNISLMRPVLALMKEDQDVVIFSVPGFDGFIGYRIKTRNIFTFGNTPLKKMRKEVGHVQSLVRINSKIINSSNDFFLASHIGDN